MLTLFFKYYLPWKRTAKQEDIIDEQIQKANALVAREKDEFEKRREIHVRKAGPSRQPRPESPERPPVQDTTAASETALQGEEAKQSTESIEKREAEEETGAAVTAEPAPVDRHDDAGDVMEEGEEDTVIY